MPVRLMEAVLERGAGVTAALAEALERWRDDEEHDALWLVVLLGEIGGPDAVAPLIRQLHRTDLEILAEAAVEGLAKIGAPAVPALRELARTGEPAQRLYAYAGLGWIEDDTAYAALVEGLARDRELIDVLATALAHHARPEAVPGPVRRVPGSVSRGSARTSRTRYARRTIAVRRSVCRPGTGACGTAGGPTSTVESISSGRASPCC